CGGASPWLILLAGVCQKLEVRPSMRIPKRTLVVGAASVALVSMVAVGFVALHGTSNAAGSPTTYVVAFNQQSGLPANVHQIAATAGSTIKTRIAEKGGIGVVSTKPDIAAQMGANTGVLAVDTETTTKLIDTVADRPSWASGTNNGGNGSATGSDAQTMPDP